MTFENDFEKIYAVVDSFKAFSDHEHHHPDGFFAEGVDLRKVLENSYVFWATDRNIPRILADKAAFINTIRFNSYFIWLEKGIQRAHGIDLPWNADTWDALSEAISEGHKDKDFHWKILLKQGYETIILDTYWDPGSNDGHPDLFQSTFRVDKLSYGHHARAAAVECGPEYKKKPLYPWEHYHFTGKTLSDYVDMAQALIERLYRERKIVSLKTAIAYNRTVDFYPDDKSAAEKAFGKSPEEITPEELVLFGNYIFHRCFEVAAKLDIPVQVHTGLADLRGSDPMLVERLIMQYPDIRFILFHSGYPWSSQVGALAHNHLNAFPSLTWTPLISTSAAERILDEYIDIAPSISTITWGSDCWMPEESIGAQLAWKHVIARVLHKRLVHRMIEPRDIETLAGKLMRDNGRSIYLSRR